MLHSMHSFRLTAMGVLLAGFCVSASAESIGLRFSPRGNIITSDSNAPASLRFSLSRYDTNLLDLSVPASPLLLGLPQGAGNSRGNALWADWYPFETGLRTSAGLVWGDSRRSGNVFDAGDGSVRSRGFLGLGWTSAASSSSSGARWRLDADVGLSVSSPRDCLTAGAQCIAPGSPGLKPNSGGDGIRWNPFISIGASIQY